MPKGAAFCPQCGSQQPPEAPFPPPPEYRPTPSAPRGGGSGWPFGVGGLLVLLLIGGAIWYFGYYDTAGAKCQRGDLGACVVVYAEQSASASAAAASASAAAYQAQLDAIKQDNPSGCTLVYSGHDATLSVSGSDGGQTCEAIFASDNNWVVATQPGTTMDTDHQVCQLTHNNSQITVYDDGGRAYGTQFCNRWQGS